jgi:hypothetical protein
MILRRGFLAASALAALGVDRAHAQFSSCGGGGGAGATVYYVSPTGSDNNNGTSSFSPWQTITKVNAATLLPGNSVLFQGGQSFSGAIVSPSAGTPSNPITFGSYGGGRATISSGTSNGFSSTNQNGIIVRDLSFSGSASTNHGILFSNGLAGNVHLQNVQVIGCSVTGYGRNGIYVTGSAGIAGYDDVWIEGCTVSGCCTVAFGGLGTTGIGIYSPVTGYGISSKGASFNNVVILNCISHDNVGAVDTNWTGSGIFCGECNNALISNCLAYNNGATAGGAVGGPVGIWLADATFSSIDGCEVYNQQTNNNLDGDGFDLDGGCSHCTIKNSYSHGCMGAGYSVYSYTDGTVTASDTCAVINCISVGDGTNATANHPCGINLSADAPQTNVLIARNTVYCSVSTAPAMWVRQGAGGGTFTATITGNSFIVTGSQQMVHSASSPAPTSVILNGNNYYGAARFLWNNTTYTSLTAWRTAFPAQEPAALVTS